jgi:hypothetical protein
MSVTGPRIIEDGECELCAERALPYDDETDLPYCARHAAEMFAGVALEDFTVRPRRAVQMELNRLTRPLLNATGCTADESCAQDGMSRLSPGDFASVTFDTCVECAAELWTSPYLPDREWLLDLAAEVDIAEELDLFGPFT